MSGLRSYANRRDKSEPVIFDTLKAMGCRVYATNKPTDALCLYRGTVYLVECKTPLSKAGRVKLTKDQEAFIADGWPVTVLASANDAVRFVQTISKRAA